MMKKLVPDFHPMAFCGQIRIGKGEDNWCYGFSDTTGMIAVFDGCGGSGARHHDVYGGHTEAFMASRLGSGALYECIQSSFPYKGTPEHFVSQVITPYIQQSLRNNTPPKDINDIQIKGFRTLPTTIAAALLQACNDDTIMVTSIWAGDSRVYILDASGLSQLMVDDSDQHDPLEALYDGGGITNVICGETQITLNHQARKFKPPFILLAATDGCFEYVSTPMEFEAMILHTMLESSSVAQWEENLQALIASFAGDDHTLCMVSFGFKCFESIKQYFSDRYDSLQHDYLSTIWATPWENREVRRKLWFHYRRNYMKYIEGDKK